MSAPSDRTDVERMLHEYAGGRSLASRLGEIHPPRNPRSEVALQAVLAESSGPVVGVGGGPARAHPRLLNLNLAPFANVDVVADAHALPFASGSLGAVHCEAVLEHLERPELAVAEMYRSLRPGGAVFAATPFLQVFHGYPSHYQNFTLEGHRKLFARTGFEILDSGPCVGPAFALIDILSNWLREHLPTRLLSRCAWLTVRVIGRAVVQLDRWLLQSPRADVLCSTTFVLARKAAVRAAPGREPAGKAPGVPAP